MTVIRCTRNESLIHPSGPRKQLIEHRDITNLFGIKRLLVYHEKQNYILVEFKYRTHVIRMDTTRTLNLVNFISRYKEIL